MRETLSELVSDNEALREALGALEGERHAAVQGLAEQVEATRQAEAAGEAAVERAKAEAARVLGDKVHTRPVVFVLCSVQFAVCTERCPHVFISSSFPHPCMPHPQHQCCRQGRASRM